MSALKRLWAVYSRSKVQKRWRFDYWL